MDYTTAPTVDVIITHYRKTQLLQTQLKSLEGQLRPGDSVIVAEDGEDTDTEIVIHQFKSLLPIRYLTHRDQGRRLCFTRNQSLADSKADIVFFIDHDILLAPGTIARLRREIRSGWFIGLRRVMLGEELTDRAIEWTTESRPFAFQRLCLHSLVSRLEGSRHLLPLRYRGCEGAPQDWRGMAAFGFLAFRQDLLDVNGWDTRFDQDYAAEDWDLFARLEHLGVKPAFASRLCTALHLYHKPADHDLSNKNYRMLDDTLKTKRTHAEEGLQETIRSLSESELTSNP